MNFFALLGLAIGLAMDCFAVSIAAGISISKVTHKHVLKFALYFGAFHAIMPILGWLAGTSVQKYITSYDHWIAFGLLGFVGVKMIYESIYLEEEEKTGFDNLCMLRMSLFSLAVSVDALAVGISMAMLEIQILYPAAVISVTTAIITVLGFILGKKIGQKFSKYMEIAGGLIILGIGIKILIMHLIS